MVRQVCPWSGASARSCRLPRMNRLGECEMAGTGIAPVMQAGCVGAAPTRWDPTKDTRTISDAAQIPPGSKYRL